MTRSPIGTLATHHASHVEDFHEPSLSLRAQRILAYTSATGWKVAWDGRQDEKLKASGPWRGFNYIHIYIDYLCVVYLFSYVISIYNIFIYIYIRIVHAFLFA